MQLEMLVDQSIGSGRFFVTSNSREDIPMGTVFTFLFTHAMKLVDGTFEEAGISRVTEVQLEIVEIEFWRKPHPCVPYGHHAGVRFEGNGLQSLEEQLNDCPKLSNVIVATKMRDA